MAYGEHKPDEWPGIFGDLARAFRSVPLSRFSHFYDRTSQGDIIESAVDAVSEANVDRPDGIPEAGLVFNFSPWLDYMKIPDTDPVEYYPPTDWDRINDAMLESALLFHAVRDQIAAAGGCPIHAVLLDNEVRGWKAHYTDHYDKDGSRVVGVRDLDEHNAHQVVANRLLVDAIRDVFGSWADDGPEISWFGFGVPWYSGGRLHQNAMGVERRDAIAPVHYNMVGDDGDWESTFSERIKSVLDSQAMFPGEPTRLWLTVNADSGPSGYVFDVDLSPYGLWQTGDYCRRNDIIPLIYPGPHDERCPNWEADACHLWRGVNGYPAQAAPIRSGKSPTVGKLETTAAKPKEFLVASVSGANEIMLLREPGPMTRSVALVLAASIVAFAECKEGEFEAMVEFAKNRLPNED